jgi:hypothetical protein
VQTDGIEYKGRQVIAESRNAQRILLCVDAAHDRVFALGVAQVVRSYGRAKLMRTLAALLGRTNRQKSDSDSRGSGAAQPGIDRADHVLKLREIRATSGAKIRAWGTQHSNEWAICQCLLRL